MGSNMVKYPRTQGAGEKMPWAPSPALGLPLLVVEQQTPGLCSSVVAMEMRGLAKCVAFVFQQLKDDAVALVDVIAPPDFVLDSPIGRADGQLYKNLWNAVLQESKVLERAPWWPEFSANKPVVGSLSAKL